MPKNRHAEDVVSVFARRLREARDTKGWTQQQLADAMERIGYSISRYAIAKIEKGARAGVKPGEERPRNISLAEAIAFAVALDVSPAHLFLPINDDVDVALAPKVTVTPRQARAWSYGRRALDPVNTKFYEFQSPYVPTWEEEDIRRQEQGPESTAMEEQ